MHELNKSNFSKVRQMFEPLEKHSFVKAIFNGDEEGNIFVDDLKNPKSAILIVRDVWTYLAGDPANSDFIKSLNTSIINKEITHPQIPVFQFTCEPKWYDSLTQICDPFVPVRETRIVFNAEKCEFDWILELPKDHILMPINRDIYKHVASAPDDVEKMINTTEIDTGSISKGFGFAIIHDGKVVSYSVIDCVTDNRGEIFLFTDGNHRRRGLATNACRSVLEFGLANGLSKIVWDCQDTNTGSIKTAERLDLKRVYEYVMQYIVME